MDIPCQITLSLLFGFLIGKGYGPAMFKLALLPFKLAFRK